MTTPTTTLATGSELLEALERTGGHPALAWYGETSRIELSGHVLANWVIKAIGHLEGELALSAEDEVVLDLPPHWKRLVLALATWSLGGRVHASGQDAPSPDPLVVATDRPDSELADGAEEVLALDALSLAPRFAGPLPALVHDWAAEVRAFPDQLAVPLPAWSGPQPSPGTAEGAADAAGAVPTPAGPVRDAPRLLVGADGLGAMPQVLATWLAGGGIVGPAESVGAAQAEEEGISDRA